MLTENRPTWQRADVASPNIDGPVAVVAATNIPYVANANNRQNLGIYLPYNDATATLVGTPVYALPGRGVSADRPRYLVHIHGGAWRDPQLSSTSIEATVAHAFADAESGPIQAVAALNYTLSPFPTHATQPHDPIRDNHREPSREGVHPQHISDVLHGLELLRSYGLADDSYVLSGHSCGACLACQVLFKAPSHYGLGHLREPPRPAALVGLNGLFDLPGLVHSLDAAHEHLRPEYTELLSNAFGTGQDSWPGASPAHVAPRRIQQRLQDGLFPRVVLLDCSVDDQLVPIGQRDRLEENLRNVKGLRVVSGHRSTGAHATPWEQGNMAWDAINDALAAVDDVRNVEGRAASR